MSLASAIKNGYVNKLYAEDSSAHDWYRFILSFPPHLVRDYIVRFGLNEDSRILDPFSGTGTTVVEAKKHGIESIGLEAHPMTQFAGSVKVNWSIDPQGLMAHANKIAELATKNLKKLGITESISLNKNNSAEIDQNAIEALLGEKYKLILKDSISLIPLEKTLILLKAIETLKEDLYYSHERLALAKALVTTIGNLHFGPEVGVGKPKIDTPVISSWLSNIEAMSQDLDELRDHNETIAVVHHIDSRSPQSILEFESIDACITSPPYPNEKDYTRTTRLESVLLGFINSKADLQTLKRGLVRSNSRTVFKGDEDDIWISDHLEIKQLAKEIENRRIELEKTSGFERQYTRVVELYFGGMARHLANLRSSLRNGARLAYVVGDQASFFRVMIRTGKLLANIADSLGYEVEDIELFRSRIATATKEQLREECVILRWRGFPKLKPIKSDLNNLEGNKIMPDETKPKLTTNRYTQIIERVFKEHYKTGDKEVKFSRDEFENIAKELNINLPKNLGDIIYSFRYRVSLPDSIKQTAPEGEHWIIRPAGRSLYAFALTKEYEIVPNALYDKISIPDATPGLIVKYALNDEQALLAKLRYNRLIDIFSGITCYSLQNHLRTSITGIGQVETDEVYVGIDKQGVHHVFPVQAKGGRDKLNVVQIEQDFALCASKFPNLVCHPIAAQFLGDEGIALFEFKMGEDGVKIVTEKHYQLVSPEKVTVELLAEYKKQLGNSQE